MPTDEQLSAIYELNNKASHEDGLRAVADAARAEALEEVNTPEIADFLVGVQREAAHQRLRWGDAHDRSKSAENWFWLLGYLAGKALRSAIAGDKDKARHHCISSAAALANWHDAINRDESGNGSGLDRDLQEPAIRALAAGKEK